jgi:hypothetical protein
MSSPDIMRSREQIGCNEYSDIWAREVDGIEVIVTSANGNSAGGDSDSISQC